MRRRLHRAKAAPVVPTASMADIAFLLIIFFMLTTSFSPDRTQVGLPSSVVREQVRENPAIVAITAGGVVVFSDGESESQPIIAMDDLKIQARQIVDAFPATEFVIKADRDAEYRYIDEVLETLRNAGVQNIGLLTTQEVGSGIVPQTEEESGQEGQSEEDGNG